MLEIFKAFGAGLVVGLLFAAIKLPIPAPPALAVLLDILHEKEHMSSSELEKLVSVEFFNALFVLSRSVGFISHFIDQKRLDEGLFRLPEELVAEAEL